MASVSMDNHQQVTATLPPIVDKRGNPASVDGVPAWALSDDTIATVVPAADGLSAVIAASGPLGSVNVTASADADLGAGVVPIFWSGTITVTAGQAVGGDLGFSAPVDQP